LRQPPFGIERGYPGVASNSLSRKAFLILSSSARRGGLDDPRRLEAFHSAGYGPVRRCRSRAVWTQDLLYQQMWLRFVQARILTAGQEEAETKLKRHTNLEECQRAVCHRVACQINFMKFSVGGRHAQPIFRFFGAPGAGRIWEMRGGSAFPTRPALG